MANGLPEDLVTEILLWLPVVSLLRFKSVCKSWYALITHQNFITKHLLHNKNYNSNTLLLLKPTADHVVSTLSYETLQVSLTQPLPPPYFEIDKKVWTFVLGSCNGLVCLFDALRVVIWNPATKETKLVPKSNLSHFPDGIGFGFDAKTNDYKIINLLKRYDDPNSIRSEKIVQSEVYSLRSDSWRKGDSPPCFLCSGFSATYINGVASWEASADDWGAVLSFDMSDEKFLKTRLPDDVLNNCCRHFLVLNESIAMAVSIWSNGSFWDVELSEICFKSFDIWVLLEVGVKDSWTKLFTIGPFTGIQRPLGFWKNNDTMFLEKYGGQLALYDSSTKEMTNLQTDHGDSLSWQMVTYMETLVSVKGKK